MEGRFMFQWGGRFVFQIGVGASFLNGGWHPMGGIAFGGGGFRKKLEGGSPPSPPPPTMGNPEMVVMTSLDANYGFEDFF